MGYVAAQNLSFPYSKLYRVVLYVPGAPKVSQSIDKSAVRRLNLYIKNKNRNMHSREFLYKKIHTTVWDRRHLFPN